jgi:hypothetical protein
MAYFAEINAANEVIQVLSVSDAQEHRGQEFLSNDVGLGGTWIQTSYNSTIRKNFAGIGYTYNLELDAFIAPKPFESWVLDEETCKWIAPSPYPEDDFNYAWNEETLSWEEDVI